MVKRYEKLPYKAFPTPARRGVMGGSGVPCPEGRAVSMVRARCRTEGEGAAIELRNPP
jgi:hypothetical protein